MALAKNLVAEILASVMPDSPVTAPSERQVLMDSNFQGATLQDSLATRGLGYSASVALGSLVSARRNFEKHPAEFGHTMVGSTDDCMTVLGASLASLGSLPSHLEVHNLTVVRLCADPFELEIG